MQRTKATALVGAAALLAASCATAGGTPAESIAPPISKAQARSLPEDDVRGIVVAQFRDILTEYPRPSTGKRPKNLLTDLSYWTRPIGGGTPNVCRYDKVRFSFEPVEAGDEGAGAAVRVSGAEAYGFYFLVGDVDPERNLSDRERRQLTLVCGDRNAADEHAISADSESTLVDVVGWLRRMNAMSYAEFERVDVSCNFGPELNKQGCRRVVKSLSPDRLSSASTIECPGWPSKRCAEADVGDIRLRISGDADSGTPSAIEAGELISFADVRID